MILLKLTIPYPFARRKTVDFGYPNNRNLPQQVWSTVVRVVR